MDHTLSLQNHRNTFLTLRIPLYIAGHAKSRTVLVLSYASDLDIILPFITGLFSLGLQLLEC